MSGTVEITPGTAAVHSCYPPDRIQCDGLHWRQIKYEAAIARTEPCYAVAAATDGERQTFVPREIDAADHVSDIGACNDEPRAAVDRRVVNAARGIISLIGRANDPAPQL
jgi:hypothetical protein